METIVKHALGSLSLQQWAEMTDEERIEHKNHVEKLKQEGKFGKIVETKFVYTPMPEFDNRPTNPTDVGFLIPRGMRR